MGDHSCPISLSRDSISLSLFFLLFLSGASYPGLVSERIEVHVIKPVSVYFDGILILCDVRNVLK